MLISICMHSHNELALETLTEVHTFRGAGSPCWNNKPNLILEVSRIFYDVLESQKRALEKVNAYMYFCILSF